MVRPLSSVGLYVPGGKAAYPSSVLMNALPAKVAGVKKIVMVVPTPRGEINNHILAAAKIAGVDLVYRVGGAQAVAALAYGTETVPKVDKIVGPGNIYVATAKKMVFGDVDIDMIAGPSEVLIISDASGEPSHIAADMLAQAEHDEMAASILITTSSEFAQKVSNEVSRQLEKLSRREIAQASINNRASFIVAKDLDEAFDLSNEVAPEHLELALEDPDQYLNKVDNAGAIFVGHYTPEALGDYIAGPNHVLPTGGSAKFFSPLGTYDFIKRSSILSFSESAFKRLGKHAERIADVEGLEAHGNTIRIRMGDEI
jgi:histidinol dehydrogenase